MPLSVGTRRLRRAKPVAREETLSNCEWSWCIAGAGQRRRLSWDTESERNGTGSCFSFTRSGRLQAMMGGAVRQGRPASQARIVASQVVTFVYRSHCVHLNFLKPIWLACSLKHLLQIMSSYFLMRPSWLVQQRHARESFPYFLG